MKTFQLKYVLSLALAFFICLTPTFAQTATDEKLALQFFNNEEYDKAVVYFEKLYNKTNETSYYERLLQCYLYMEEYKDAEKLVKKAEQLYLKRAKAQHSRHQAVASSTVGMYD